MYNEFIDELNAAGAWEESGATLGRRAGLEHQICVWFTREPDVRAALGGSIHRMSSDQVRNSLGLISMKEKESLLLVTFPASALCPPNAIRVAQPTFADGGNERFAASQPGTRYKTNRDQEWGTTVHLEKYAAKEDDCCGLPERVANPIPIDSSVFEVHYLGCLGSSYETSAAEDGVFAQWLMQGDPEEDVLSKIINKVLS